MDATRLPSAVEAGTYLLVLFTVLRHGYLPAEINRKLDLLLSDGDKESD